MVNITKAPQGHLAATLCVNNGVKNEIGKTDGLFLALSNETLITRANEADRICIISPYIDVSFLQSLFEHKNATADKEITMVFARPSPAALPELIPCLNDLADILRRKGNKRSKIKVAIAGDTRFLHTKLYRFERGKRIRTLVGSANATSNGFNSSDEILVEIIGHSSAIDKYIDHTVAKAENCRGVVLTCNERYTSFVTMLRDGYIYFKPTRTVPYHVDCFDGIPGVSKALQQVIEGNPLPFHEGQSLGMLSILKLLNIDTSSVGAPDEKSHRTKVAPLAIETAFGYWVPTAYRVQLEEQIKAQTAKKAKMLLKRGERLKSITDESIRNTVRQKYLDVVNDRLKIVVDKLTNQNRLDIESRVIRRATAVKKMLGDERACIRLATPLDGTPVPEVWEDPQSKNEMLQSFCEYVSWKLHAPGRAPRIVKKLREWFELKHGDDADEVRRKIDAFFISNTKARNDWDGDTSGDQGDGVISNADGNFGVWYYLDACPSDEDNYAAAEYSNDCPTLRKRIGVVLAAGRYKLAKLYEWNSKDSGWNWLADIPA